MQLSPYLLVHMHDSSLTKPSNIIHTPPALFCAQNRWQLRKVCTTAVTYQ